jgi:hypothetical protein
MPQLVDHLKAMNAHAARREAADEVLASSIAKISQRVDTQSTQLQLLTSGGLTFRLAAAAAVPLAAATTTARQLLPASSYAGADTAATAVAAIAAPPARDQQDQEPPPGYRMRRAVKMVDRLWHEWTVGFEGNPLYPGAR